MPVASVTSFWLNDWSSTVAYPDVVDVVALAEAILQRAALADAPPARLALAGATLGTVALAESPVARLALTDIGEFSVGSAS